MSRKKYEKCLDILNLKTGASLKDIKSAYKKLVLKFLILIEHWERF